MTHTPVDEALIAELTDWSGDDEGLDEESLEESGLTTYEAWHENLTSGLNTTYPASLVALFEDVLCIPFWPAAEVTV